MKRQLARRVDYNSRFPMFISLDWISDFVDISDIDPKVVADRLTMATAEVEGISTITRYVDGVIVGEITNATPFTTPEGKTRVYCDVNCGARVYKTVCGATNARVGLKAPFAPAGIALGDKKIEAAEVYGYKSEGILCSAAELGMSDWHDYAAIVPMKDGKVITLRHNYAEPNEIFAMEMGKEPVQLSHVNDDMLAKLDSIEMRKEIVKTTDGKDMTVWVVLPPNFDPNKKYPSIFFCEGGPQSPVSQFFSYRWNFRLMASQGYVVIAPNRRGLPGFGTEWNAQISGDYGGQNMKDYMSAATYMKQQPYIDGDRMGAVGASYGGYSVYWLAGNHNNMFACFLAHAGIFNLEAQYLETEELWFTQWDLGGPCWEKDNAKAMKTYNEANPKNFVQNWNTPIMITAGELDYRIVFTQACQAFDAAQIRGIPSRMLLFPEENHWILKPQNALMWHREYFRWLDTWLKPGSEAAKAYKLQQDSIAKIKAEETKGEPTPMPKKQENLHITNPDLAK